MPSYQVGQACYPDIATAIKAMAAQSQGGFVQVGTTPYMVKASFVSPSSIKYDGVQINGGTGTFTKTVAVTPLPCNLPDTADGLAMAWLVVAVWAAAFAITVIRRAVPA